ncbi:MAG: YgfZ/GcvT domain-containing protein [Phormidesmis sp.]
MSASIGTDQILANQPVIFDRSDWGHIRLTGADRVRFLHNQTTNNIEQLAAGQGCQTIFVTSTGRTIDMASVYALPDALYLTVSPGMAQSLYDWMDRYIFFSDQVTLVDESEQQFLLTVLGKHADAVIEKIGAESLIGQPEFTHHQLTLPLTLAQTNAVVTVAVGSDLAIEGYTVWGNQDVKAAVWSAVCEAGGVPGTAEQWEQLRIQQGRPAPGKELTDDDNPLEAGLWNGVSFEKGCYIGQETIARLNTYQGVKKRLWGVVLEETVPVGTHLTQVGKKVGKITSISAVDSVVFGLAYVRTKAGGSDLVLEAEGVAAQVVSLPFNSHQYYTAVEK